MWNACACARICATVSPNSSPETYQSFAAQAVLAEHAYSAELHGVPSAPQLRRLWLDTLLLQVPLDWSPKPSPALNPNLT